MTGLSRGETLITLATPPQLAGGGRAGQPGQWPGLSPRVSVWVLIVESGAAWPAQPASPGCREQQRRGNCAGSGRPGGSSSGGGGGH